MKARRVVCVRRDSPEPVTARPLRLDPHRVVWPTPAVNRSISALSITAVVTTYSSVPTLRLVLPLVVRARPVTPRLVATVLISTNALPRMRAQLNQPVPTSRVDSRVPRVRPVTPETVMASVDVRTSTNALPTTVDVIAIQPVLTLRAHSSAQTVRKVIPVRLKPAVQCTTNVL